VLAAASILAVASTRPAVAQGFFESLFGRQPHYSRPEPLPPQASSYAEPFSPPSQPRRSESDYAGYTWRGTVYCVRTCDGRYFPMQHHAGASSAELCKSFCPAAKTMVFSGGKIDSSVASNGTHYADLDNAFVYRDRVVDNCSCNGKDGLGLARVSPIADPTLRPGDIVATNEGLANFHGKSTRTAEFTPINPSSSAWAEKLSEIKVRPSPAGQQIEVAPVEDKPADLRRRHRGLQALR
jgi:hypothetical protein